MVHSAAALLSTYNGVVESVMCEPLVALNARIPSRSLNLTTGAGIAHTEICQRPRQNAYNNVRYDVFEERQSVCIRSTPLPSGTSPAVSRFWYSDWNKPQQSALFTPYHGQSLRELFKRQTKRLPSF